MGRGGGGGGKWAAEGPAWEQVRACMRAVRVASHTSALIRLLPQSSPWPGLFLTLPLSPSISSSITCFSLSPLSLFLTPSDTLYPLPLQLSTPLSWPYNDGISSQISGDWAAFFPAQPHAMLGINMVPGDAQPVLRPPSCPAARFLGHTAGEQVRGAGTSRMEHREIKLNAAPVLRKESVNRA